MTKAIRTGIGLLAAGLLAWLVGYLIATSVWTDGRVFGDLLGALGSLLVIAGLVVVVIAVVRAPKR